MSHAQCPSCTSPSGRSPGVFVHQVEPNHFESSQLRAVLACEGCLVVCSLRNRNQSASSVSPTRGKHRQTFGHAQAYLYRGLRVRPSLTKPRLTSVLTMDPSAPAPVPPSPPTTPGRRFRTKQIRGHICHQLPARWFYPTRAPSVTHWQRRLRQRGHR